MSVTPDESSRCCASKKKPIILAANKVDSPLQEADAALPVEPRPGQNLTHSAARAWHW